MRIVEIAAAIISPFQRHGRFYTAQVLREGSLNLSTPYYASRGVVTVSDAVQLPRVTFRD